MSENRGRRGWPHFVWRARVLLGADLARSRPVVRGCRGASRPSGKKKSVATQLARTSVETFGLAHRRFEGKARPDHPAAWARPTRGQETREAGRRRGRVLFLQDIVLQKVALPVLRWSTQSAGYCPVEVEPVEVEPVQVEPVEVEPVEAGPRHSAGRLLRVKSHQAATTTGLGSRWGP